MKKMSKKLALKREALKTLSAELDSAAGGFTEFRPVDTKTASRPSGAVP